MSVTVPLALEVVGMSKTFGASRVLRDVSLTVQPGEVHALVGQNGCGKSTLVKCLSGYYEPDAGSTIRVAGQALATPFTPGKATSAGLRFVHQDLAIVQQLTVAENLGLGRGYSQGPARNIRWDVERARAGRILERVHCGSISPDLRAGRLSLAMQTMLAIGRAIQGSEDAAAVVVLDEPSASLPQDDVRILHEAIRRVAALGTGVLLISHRISEIFEVASRATVLRDGAVIGTHDVATLDHDSLAELIVGRRMAAVFPAASTVPAAKPTVTLQARGISGGRVSGLDLELHAGEIVGLAGLRGSGRSTAARLLSGVQRRSVGTVQVAGADVPAGDVRGAFKCGVVYVTEDRKKSGVFPGMTVAENILLPRLPEFRRRFGGLRSKEMRRCAAGLIQGYGVRPSNPDAPMRSLSGGNQQKVVLARWLGLDPVVAVLDEPVQGIDVGAKAEIFEILLAAADRGVSIVVVDSDLENLSKICDRVLVLHDGTVHAELTDELAHDPDEIARNVLLAHLPQLSEEAS